MRPLVFASEHNVRFSVMSLRDADDTSFRRSRSPAFATKNSPENDEKQTNASKRGRPRADVITSLILKGSASKGKIRCDICSRIFPREKSLQAHMRTHTGKSVTMLYVNVHSLLFNESMCVPGRCVCVCV